MMLTATAHVARFEAALLLAGANFFDETEGGRASHAVATASPCHGLTLFRGEGVFQDAKSAASTG